MNADVLLLLSIFVVPREICWEDPSKRTKYLNLCQLDFGS